MGHVLQLKKAKGRVDFAQFGIDSGSYDSDFINKTKVLEVVDALFRFGIGADDCTALESVKDLSGVKAKYR